MIAIDWGTTSFRAYRLDDATGAVREQRQARAGLLSCNGQFGAVLERQIAGWDDRLVVMAGMVGSRSGWREVPYVPCPAALHDIAAALCELDADALPGRRVVIAPGVSQPGGEDGAAPDVMRGEETQLLGLMDLLEGDGPHLVCLPGTHSKWVHLTRQRILRLRTAMTGELYALLRRHSLLAALMPAATGDTAEDGDDAESFARGVAASALDGGLLHHLFGVRTQGLFAQLEGAKAPSYLSGLLIGHELRALLPAGAATVHLIGGAALRLRYGRALRLLGTGAREHGEDLVARGLLRIAGARGLR
jgi:2-dehydro-3-deoxygalactonokinase